MNILLVTRDVKDGIGTTVKNLVWQFEKNPEIEKITIICPSKFSTGSKKTNFEIVSSPGKYFFTKEPIFSLNAYLRINKLLKHEKYTIIHLHSNILSFAFNRKTVISTFQGSHRALISNVNVPILSTFHNTKRATFGMNNLKGYKYRLGKYLHLPLIFLDDIRIKGSDLVTCVSKFTLEELKKVSDTKGWNKKFVYVPNGIDTDIYKPIHVNRNEHIYENYNIDLKDKSVGLYIGRLESGKGVIVLAEAVKHIPNFILLIAGEGIEKENLEKYHNIKCLGYVSDQNEKNLLLNCADLFILPSLYENFPTVIPEAMAAKRAIVSTEVGMVPEILEHRYNALARVGDVNDLRIKIENMISNRDIVESEAQLNFDYAHRNLKWEKIAQVYLDLYNSVK